jgi:hypothetical protein
MTYRLFSTDFEVSKAAYQAQKSRLTTYNYNELDDALGMAKRIIGYGGVPWEIEQGRHRDQPRRNHQDVE